MRIKDVATIRTGSVFLAILMLGPISGSAQVLETPLAGDIAAVKAEIRSAEEEDQQLAGGLVKSLISLRLATLRQTLALLDQRSKAGAAKTTLQFTVDGKPFTLPADAPAQLAAVESEIAENSAKIRKQENEVARYSGGLVLAMARTTLATLRQSEAMLEQRRLALKYSLPQFMGFKDLPVGAGSAAQTRPSDPSSSPRLETPPTELPSDCLKVVFGSYCLGGPTSALPPNPGRKTDDMWLYTEPQPTAITTVDGRVAIVGRLYTPGTWLTYRTVERDLVEKYGDGKDLSFFPSYADDSSSRETSIHLKKGRAIHSWPQVGFTIQLKWDSRDNVALLYFHDELEAKRAAKKKEQY